MEVIMKTKTSSKKKKSKSFNPNRNYVTSAMEDFIKNGGKITVLEKAVENDIERVLSSL